MAISYSPYKQYKEASASTTDQGRLILMVYDCAIKNCIQAIDAIECNHIELRCKKLFKVQDCITELMVSLNMDAGGEISKNLYRLYDYYNFRLTQANIRNSKEMIEEVLNHLKDLRGAWVIAIEKLRKGEDSLSQKDKKVAMLG